MEMSRERYAQHCDANALYAYMTTLGSTSSKGERNKAALVSIFRKDRKNQSLNPLTSNQIQSVGEIVKLTDDKVTTSDNKGR